MNLVPVELDLQRVNSAKDLTEDGDSVAKGQSGAVGDPYGKMADESSIFASNVFEKESHFLLTVFVDSEDILAVKDRQAHLVADF